MLEPRQRMLSSLALVADRLEVSLVEVIVSSRRAHPAGAARPRASEENWLPAALDIVAVSGCQAWLAESRLVGAARDVRRLALRRCLPRPHQLGRHRRKLPNAQAPVLHEPCVLVVARAMSHLQQLSRNRPLLTGILQREIGVHPTLLGLLAAAELPRRSD